MVADLSTILPFRYTNDLSSATVEDDPDFEPINTVCFLGAHNKYSGEDRLSSRLVEEIKGVGHWNSLTGRGSAAARCGIPDHSKDFTGDPVRFPVQRRSIMTGAELRGGNENDYNM